MICPYPVSKSGPDEFVKLVTDEPDILFCEYSDADGGVGGYFAFNLLPEDNLLFQSPHGSPDLISDQADLGDLYRLFFCTRGCMG